MNTYVSMSVYTSVLSMSFLSSSLTLSIPLSLSLSLSLPSLFPLPLPFSPLSLSLPPFSLPLPLSPSLYLSCSIPLHSHDKGPVEFRQYFQANYFNATKLNDGPVDRGTKDFTFLLFNEVAYEDNGGEKARYARLGRLCSVGWGDQGVVVVMLWLWWCCCDVVQILMLSLTYRRAGNFHGVIISWISQISLHSHNF